MHILTITKQPADATATAGSNVQFSVEANITQGCTYQWQYRRIDTGTWHNTTMSGYNTAILTVAATQSRNGYQYCCMITGSKNCKLESEAAILTVE